jgi:hypothetical protein
MARLWNSGETFAHLSAGSTASSGDIDEGADAEADNEGEVLEEVIWVWPFSGTWDMEGEVISAAPRWLGNYPLRHGEVYIEKAALFAALIP